MPVVIDGLETFIYLNKLNKINMFDWNKFVKKTRIFTIPIAIILGLVSLYYAFVIWDYNNIAGFLLLMWGILCIFKGLLLIKGSP